MAFADTKAPYEFEERAMFQKVILVAAMCLSAFAQAQNQDESLELRSQSELSQEAVSSKAKTKGFYRDEFDWEHGAGRDEWGDNNHHMKRFHPCEFFHPRYDRMIACIAVGHHEFGGYHKYRAFQRIRGRRERSCYRAERRAAIRALERCEYGTFGDICRIVKCVVK